MDRWEMFDCITNSCFVINRAGVVERCKELGFDYTLLYKLGKSFLSINSRYLLAQDWGKTFTVVDYDTRIEYVCCKPATLFLHLEIPHNTNEGKYVYELTKGRQKLASIGGRVFHLKGTNLEWRKYVGTKKGYSPAQNIIKEKMRLHRRVKYILTHRVWVALKSVGAKKTDKTMSLVGCDLNFFKKYIQGRFTKGMTFDNHGEWHIDHIIPCSRFDLTDVAQQKKCFHFTNMQPIWKSTKVAMKYGESQNYIGNHDKSDKDLPIDHWLVKMLTKYDPLVFTEDRAISLALKLSRAGARKVGY